MEQDSYYSFDRLIVNVQERITIMQRKPTLRQSGDRQLADPGPGGNASGGNMQFAMAGGGTMDAAMAITAENAMVIAALNSMNPDMSNDGIIRRIEGDSETDENVKIEGKNSTGRTTPNDLVEEMAMDSTKKNPFDPVNNHFDDFKFK